MPVGDIASRGSCGTVITENIVDEAEEIAQTRLYPRIKIWATALHTPCPYQALEYLLTITLHETR